jgi:hypothetical protein
MSRQIPLFVGFLLAVSVSSEAAQPPATPAATDGTLSVTVTYAGKGDVKAGNELGIYLFDTPRIGPDVPPIASQVLEQNGGTVVFKNLTGAPVYIAVSYDQDGTYEEGAPDPPLTMPVSIHVANPVAGAPPVPEPVEPGVGAKVHIKFDDRMRLGALPRAQ